MVGTLAASNLLSTLFAVLRYNKTRSSTDRWALLAIFILIAMLAFGTGIAVTVAVYAITLIGARKTLRMTVGAILLRVVVPLFLSIALSVGCYDLLFNSHYFDRPTVEANFGHNELVIFEATLTELIEADDSHAIGIYSYTADDEANSKLGFALFATKDADGRTLYRYIDDSGLCYPHAIYSGDNEGYTVDGQDSNGFPAAETHPWGEWHRVSDDYAVCLIPVSSDRTPNEGIEVVRSAKVTIDGVEFVLYVGMGDVE